MTKTVKNNDKSIEDASLGLSDICTLVSQPPISMKYCKCVIEGKANVVGVVW